MRLDTLIKKKRQLEAFKRAFCSIYTNPFFVNINCEIYDLKISIFYDKEPFVT